MYSKFIKLIVLRSLLVCCGFAGRVLYGRFPQLCRTRERSTSHYGLPDTVYGGVVGVHINSPGLDGRYKIACIQSK